MWKVSAVMSSEAVWISAFFFPSFMFFFVWYYFFPSFFTPLSSFFCIFHPSPPSLRLWKSSSPPVASLLWYSPHCCNHKSTFPPSPPCQRGSSWASIFSSLILFSYLKSFTIFPQSPFYDPPSTPSSSTLDFQKHCDPHKRALIWVTSSFFTLLFFTLQHPLLLLNDFLCHIPCVNPFLSDLSLSFSLCQCQKRLDR